MSPIPLGRAAAARSDPLSPPQGKVDRRCPPAPPPYLTASPPPSSNPSLFLCRNEEGGDSLTIFGVAEAGPGKARALPALSWTKTWAKAYLTVLGNHRCPRPRAPGRCPLPRFPVSREVGVAQRAAPAVSQPACAWGSSLSEGLRLGKLLLSEQAVLDALPPEWNR